MARDRDFLDYAQLGLIAGQTAKLHQMSAELSALRESTERQERHRERQGQLRQMILIAEELLTRLEGDKDGTETPLKRQFVLAYETEQFLKTAGVLPPVGFKSYEDKKRATALEKRLDTFRAGLLKLMPEADRRDAELCVKYMAEERDLANFIRHKETSRSKREILIPPGYEIDLKPLEDKFGPKTPVRELRAIYKERRDFVRSIVGSHYLASQDAGKTRRTRAATKNQNRSAIPLTHEKPLPVTQSVGRVVVMAIVIVVVVAALVGLAALLT